MGMKIQNNYNNNVNFGVKLDTNKVLEAASGRILLSDGIAGFKDVIYSLTDKPIKGIGSRGYRYYAMKFGEKIIAKYPEIAEANKKVAALLEKYPSAAKEHGFRQELQPIIEELGQEIDITL